MAQSMQTTVEKNTRDSAGEVRELKLENRDVILHIKSLLEKAETEKKARDSQNAAVKQLIEEIAKLRIELLKQETELKSLAKATGSAEKDTASLPLLKRQIESLEYMLHTQGSSPTQEKQISKQINQLVASAKALEAAVPKLKEMQKTREAVKELRVSITAKVTQLREHSSQGKKHHEQMLKFFQEAEKAETKLSASLKELDEKRAEYKLLKTEERKHAPPREKQRVLKQPSKAEVKKKADEVLAKFKSGKPITAEEMQLLNFAEAEF